MEIDIESACACMYMCVLCDICFCIIRAATYQKSAVRAAHVCNANECSKSSIAAVVHISLQICCNIAAHVPSFVLTVGRAQIASLSQSTWPFSV